MPLSASDFSKSGRALESLPLTPPSSDGAAVGAAQAAAPAPRGPFLPSTGAQCIPVDKLENRTAFSASAYVLLALACNPGPKNAPAPRSPPLPSPPHRQAGDGLQAACPAKGTATHDGALSRPWHGLKARAPQQAGKVCRKGSSCVPLLRVPGSTPWFQLALESGLRQAPGRSRGCLRVWMGRGCPPELPQSPSLSRPSCPPAVRAGRAQRSPANSWMGSWESGRPLLSSGAPRKGKGGRSGCLILVPSNSVFQALAGSRQPAAGSRQPGEL